MYDEENVTYRIGINWKDIIIKVIMLAVFLFLLIWLFPKADLDGLYNKVYTDNIATMKDAAKSYIKNYTGLSDEELDKYDDLTTAYLCIISDMYDNRTFTVDSDKNNRMLQSIMDMHCINLL